MSALLRLRMTFCVLTSGIVAPALAGVFSTFPQSERV